METGIRTRNSGSFTRVRTSELGRQILKYKAIYLILFPGILFFIIFSYVPMYGITLAFKEYSSAKGIMGSPWVGFEKFEMIWKTAEFWRAFKNTIVISGLKIVFVFPIPIIIAILLNELKSVAYKRTLQTIYTFPHFLSWVIISGIIGNLLSNDGAANNFLELISSERYGFLVDPNVFRVLLIFSDAWKEAGWASIIYLAAISSIDPSLYESAYMDGANRWHRMIYITLPGIAGIASILFILRVGQTMNAGFDQILNLYSPPVFKVADIIDTYIYRRSFQAFGDWSFTTAAGLFKGVINCFLLLMANYIVKKRGHESVL